MRRYLYLTLFLLVNTTVGHCYCEKFCERLPYFCVGQGYYWSGKKWSGSVLQLEYKSSRSFFRCFHTQTGFAAFEFRSFIIYSGIDVEAYFTDNLLLTINFSPGVYFQGSGRNLGFPIEFRSCMELAYQFCNKVRVGGQMYHISNASLGKRNPGINAFVFSLSLPL